MIEIIEQKSISKTGIETDNEDGVFISDNYVAVVDGATSKDSNLYEGRTGGQVVRDIILETLAKLKGNETSVEGVHLIQNEIEKQFPAAEFFHACASAVIFNVRKRCIWMVGDCQACVNGKKYTNNKIIDDINSHTRAMVLEAFIMDGNPESEILKNDIGREMIMPFLKLQKKFENKSGYFGYPVFNNVSMPEDVLHSKIVNIDIPENAEIVLASDGYPELKPSLKESEEELAKIIKKDPFCYKTYFSTKGLKKGNVSFDDRTYIRFKS
ncbi:MAG: hypothetical protein SO141_03185 [Alphaproteobacteria bacterium]|nr:hypothetical protein [Alphaproteobacteria bacterium]